MRASKLKRDILNNKKEIELRLSKEDERVLMKEKEAKLNFDYEKAHRDSKVRFSFNKMSLINRTDFCRICLFDLISIQI